MNTKKKKKYSIEEATAFFKQFFDFDNMSTENMAYSHSGSVMYFIEKEMDKQGISRKELAKKVGTSASYLTQLFSLNKIINLKMMTKLEKALNFKLKFIPKKDLEELKTKVEKQEQEIKKLIQETKRQKIKPESLLSFSLDLLNKPLKNKTENKILPKNINNKQEVLVA